MNRICILILTLFLSLSINLNAQEAMDGFMKNFGQLDMALSYGSEKSDQYYTQISGQDTSINLSIQTQSISLFGAYGLSDDLNVILSVPYIKRTSTAKGLQDGGIFVKYRSLKAKIKEKVKINLMTGLGITFPLSNYDPQDGRAIGQQAVTLPLRAIYQMDFSSGLFINLTGGYTLRLDAISDDFVNEVRTRTDDMGNLLYPDFEAPALEDYISFSAKIGFGTNKHYVDAWFFLQQTQGGTNYRDERPAVFQSLGISYQQVGGTYYFAPFPKMGYFVSAAKVLNGRNIGDGFRWSLGLVYKFNFYGE